MKSDRFEKSHQKPSQPELNQSHVEPMIRNSFMKLLHGFLLTTFPSDTLYEFYKLHSLVINNENIKGEYLLDHIWNEDANTPVLYLNTLIDSLESLFLEMDPSFYSQFLDFIENIFSDQSFLMRIYFPAIQYLGHHLDIKKCLLDYIHLIPLSFIANATVEKLQTGENRSGLYGIYSLCQNTGFKKKGYVLDAELVFAPFIRIAPVSFKFPSYSSYTIFSQEQEIEFRLLNYTDFRYIGSSLYIGDTVYGLMSEFGSLINDLYPDLNLNINDNTMVTMITRDFVCPFRKRTVLRRNCIYGAPISIITVNDDTENYLSGQFDSSIHDSNDVCLWSSIIQKHYSLRKRYANAVTIHYNKTMQILNINNKPFVGGVQAKILSAIVKMHLYQKKELFEWRDLAADSELICDPFSTGLSTRLNRLIEALRKCPYGLYIHKMNRGKYKLIFENSMLYTEDI